MRSRSCCNRRLDTSSHSSDASRSCCSRKVRSSNNRSYCNGDDGGAPRRGDAISAAAATAMISDLDMAGSREVGRNTPDCRYNDPLFSSLLNCDRRKPRRGQGLSSGSSSVSVR